MTRTVIVSLVFIAAATMSWSAAQAESLEAALVATYTNNPSLLAQRAALRATDEGVNQALSGWRPTVSLAASLAERRSDTNLTTKTTSLQPRTLSLSVTQSLYRGGRTLAGIDSAEAATPILPQTPLTPSRRPTSPPPCDTIANPTG